MARQYRSKMGEIELKRVEFHQLAVKYNDSLRFKEVFILTKMVVLGFLVLRVAHVLTLYREVTFDVASCPQEQSSPRVSH